MPHPPLFRPLALAPHDSSTAPPYKEVPNEAYKVQQQIWDSPAHLKLCTIMVVAHSFALQGDVSSSSSSSSGGGSSGASKTVVAVASAGSHSSQETPEQQQQQQERQQQLWSASLLLWEALGCSAAALPLFSRSVRAIAHMVCNRGEDTSREDSFAATAQVRFPISTCVCVWGGCLYM
jgi:hypothetical protein